MESVRTYKFRIYSNIERHFEDQKEASNYGFHVNYIILDIFTVNSQQDLYIVKLI